MSDAEERKALLTGLLGSELSTEELVRANDLLIDDRAFREEYEALREEMSQPDELSIREPGDESLEKFRRSPYGGLAGKSGLFLIVGGYVGFLAYCIFKFFTRDEAWTFPEWMVAAMIIGGLAVFGVVIVERTIGYRSDPYKDIEK